MLTRAFGDYATNKHQQFLEIGAAETSVNIEHNMVGRLSLCTNSMVIAYWLV